MWLYNIVYIYIYILYIYDDYAYIYIYIYIYTDRYRKSTRFMLKHGKSMANHLFFWTIPNRYGQVETALVRCLDEIHHPVGVSPYRCWKTGDEEKRLKTKHWLWWFMMIYDDLWLFMMIYDDLWLFMIIYDDLSWFMMIYDDLWWFKRILKV